MATMRLLSLGFLLVLLLSPHPSATQALTDSSPHLDLPTKQTGMIWSSLPPRRRSDVPIRATARDWLTSANSVHQWQEALSPTAQSTPSLKSVASSKNSSMAVTGTQPTSPRVRTDTASLALSKALGKALPTVGSSTPSPPTLSPSTAANSAGAEPVTTGNTAEEPVKQGDNDDDEGWQPVGSGNFPTVTPVEEDNTPSPLSALGEMAQYQPPVLTVTSKVTEVQATQNALLATAGEISTTPEKGAAPPLAVTQTTTLTSVVSEGKHVTSFVSGRKVGLTSDP